MKAGFLFLIVSLFLALGTNAQKTDQKPNSPQEKSTVKREYDEKGNLIRFDSTYTYSSSGDTILNQSISPEKIQEFFSEHFGNKSDSSFTGNSFFEGFDQFFSDPFSSRSDSTFIKKFKMSPHFHGFLINPDSMALSQKDFDSFFDPFFDTPDDSVLSKLPKTEQQSKSMKDMMDMIRKHMQELQKNQQQLFDDPKNNWKGM